MHGKVRTAARRAGVAGAVTGAALLAAGALPTTAWGDDHGHAARSAGHDGASNSAHSSSAQRSSASRSTDGHNPPGNNGTVKIHDTAGDHTVHNVPHVSCTWWVDLFGFDNGQRGDISLAGQAPTGKDVAMVTLSDVLLSPDDAGGAANDWDSEFAFSATQGTSGATYVDLSALGAPAAQGYHITLTVRTHQPGENGVKHKVFWVSPCGSAAAGTSASQNSASQSSGAESGTESGTGTGTGTGNSTGTGTGTGARTGTEVAGVGIQSPSVVTGTGTGAVAPAAVTTDVLGLSMTRPGTAAATSATAAQAGSASQGAQVLGLHLTRGAQLPFTGDNTLTALLAGVSSVAIGAGLVAAGRRRRTSVTEV
jgi:hypothetical protein